MTTQFHDLNNDVFRLWFFVETKCKGRSAVVFIVCCCVQVVLCTEFVCVQRVCYKKRNLCQLIQDHVAKSYPRI